MIIEAIIRTPQFKNNKIFDYTIQKGTISTIDWIFHPTEHISGQPMHIVHFKNEEDFLNFKVE